MAQAMEMGTPRRGRTEKAALEVKQRALAAKLFLFFLSLFFGEQCQQLIFFFLIHPHFAFKSAGLLL